MGPLYTYNVWLVDEPLEPVRTVQEFCAYGAAQTFASLYVGMERLVRGNHITCMVGEPGQEPLRFRVSASWEIRAIQESHP